MEEPSKNGLITFNTEKDPEISAYETIPWKINEFHDVEFFPGKITRVYLISNQYRDMINILKQLETDDDSHKNQENQNTIAIDLEWEYTKLCLIQFCGNNICIIIRLFTNEDIQNHQELNQQQENEENLIKQNNEILTNFLNTHKFYGKGMHNDKKMLLSYFGSTFSNNLEDIEKTRLAVNDLSRNFNQMTLQFAGEPTATFKVIEMTKSDWSLPELSFRQVLYAAFDTVSLYYCYPNFPKTKNSIERSKSIQNSKEAKNQVQKSKQKQNIRYYKTTLQSEAESSERMNRVKKKGTNKKVPKMNLSVVFKKTKKRETFSYLIKNYQGTKNKLILRSFFPDLDFISCFSTENSISYLFISTFSPINNFPNGTENRQEFTQKFIDINDPTNSLNSSNIQKVAENVFLLPKVPFFLCNDSDVLFVSNLPDSIFSDEKLQELFYCFGFDQIVSRIDDKLQNSCIVEPRNAEISKRIRTFLPFLTVDGFLLKLYEYPTFLRTIRMSNIPSNFTENEIKKLFVKNENESNESDLNLNEIGDKSKLNKLTMVENCEFILKRIETDTFTAYVVFKSVEDKNFCIEKFNHFKLKKLNSIPQFADFELDLNDENDEMLIIPFTSDVHLRYLRSYELTIYPENESKVEFEEICSEFQKFGKILQMNYDKRFNNFHVQYYRKCDALNAYKFISERKNKSKLQIELNHKNSNDENYKENENSNKYDDLNIDENSNNNIDDLNNNNNDNSNDNNNSDDLNNDNNENSNENDNVDNFNNKNLNNNDDDFDNSNFEINTNDINISQDFIDKIKIEMHPDGSIVIVRDLPMEIDENEVITIFSQFGRITNLVFRDLTPMNILSVVDIFFSSPDEAKSVKTSMNKFKVGGSFIHVSIRSREDITDWKMSQRNQWVIFDETYKTIDDVFNRTKEYGKIIDYNYCNDHFLGMFDTQENAKMIIDELNLSYPTYKQFVEETNNSNYLEIVKKPSIPGNPTGPKEAAIVVDPVPSTLTEEFVEKIFCEGNATSSDEASSIVLASSLILPPLKDIIKPSSSMQQENNEIECEYPHELFITDSVKFKGQKRLVVYSPSNNVTKKLFTLLVNSEFEGKYFKPKKIDIKDLENPPPKKKSNIIFYGHEVTNPVVVIDPLPNGFGEKEIRETINELNNFEMVICPSSIVGGKSRAVLMPKLAAERRIMLKALSQKIIDNGNLHVYKYKCDCIPPSL